MGPCLYPLCLAAIAVSGGLGLLVLVVLGQPALRWQEQPRQSPAPPGLHPHPCDTRAERHPAGRPALLPPSPEDALPSSAGRVPDPPARVPQDPGG